MAAAIAAIFGAIDTSEADWDKALFDIGIMSLTGVLLVMITEEGFFRGWFWASLKRSGKPDRRVLLRTTFAPVIWHLSAVRLDTGFDLPAKKTPIFLINIIILGLLWDILRMVSGSVLAPAISHAVWNDIGDTLFGFGEKVGVLGIADTHPYNPEVGLLGIVSGSAFLALIWRKYAT